LSVQLSKVLAALQQPHSLACLTQCAGSLHRLSGLIASLRPITCSLEFGPPTNLLLIAFITTGSARKNRPWHAITTMSSGAQDDSPQQPAADLAGRRASFGRALERFKTVFTRRGSNKAAPVTGSSPPTIQSQVPTPAVEDAGIAPAPPTPSTVATHEAALEVDDDDIAIDDFDDTEEPIIPVDATTSRPGLSEEKAKVLFEKYGLRYPAAKRPQQDPPNKIRRIEKPVRIRLHWNCHQCKTAFAQDKVCSSCGHERCGDCTRSPPQRVMRLLEKTKREKESAEILARAASASPEDDAVLGASATMLAEQVPAEEALAGPSPRVQESKSETEPIRFIYTIRTASLGGTGGLELYHMAKHNYDRNAARPAIQRVFKQPRQRVRWICDRCDSIFTNRDTCSNCQHEKCVTCTRSPYVPHSSFTLGIC
jgi:hypothetical protein